MGKTAIVFIDFVIVSISNYSCYLRTFRTTLVLSGFGNNVSSNVFLNSYSKPRAVSVDVGLKIVPLNKVCLFARRLASV